MSCRRAFEIDLVEFLAAPARADFAAFRAHYPTCAECATEVRAWTDVVALLRESAPFGNGAHPEPALLLRYEEDPQGLDRAARADVERHLASCPTCRDELRALRAFPLEALAPGPVPARRATRWLPRLRGVVLHPAFAYALVAVLLWPAGLGLLRDEPVQPMVARERAAAEFAAPEVREEALAAKRDVVGAARSPAVVGAEPTTYAPESSPLAKAVQETPPPHETAPEPPADLVKAYLERRMEEGERAASRTLAAAPPPEPELRVAIPVSLRAANEIEVLLRSADGMRELRERVRAPVPSPFGFRLPRDWPRQQSYEVEVRDLDPARAREPGHRIEVSP
jgi:hypothetical protein